MYDYNESLKISNNKNDIFLDINYIWKNRISSIAFFNRTGNYDIIKIIKCNKCFNGVCHKSKINYIRDKKVLFIHKTEKEKCNIISNGIEFKINEDTIQELNEKEIIEKHLKDNEKKVKEREELIQKVKNIMNDGSIFPLFDDSVSDTYSTITYNFNIDIELGKILNKTKNIIELYCGNIFSLINILNDFKTDINLKTYKYEKNQVKCFIEINENGYPVYLILEYFIKKINSHFNLIDCCGFFKEKSLITVKYSLTFPKNNAARDFLDEKFRDIIQKKVSSLTNSIINK